MIGVVKVISTSFDKAKRLVVKVLYRGKIEGGKGDIRTPLESSPFGIDSNPVEKKVAIYAQTEVLGQYYIIGYLNTNRLAASGEFRAFSTDSNGELQAYLWLKNSGNIVELNGNADNAVLFNKLKTEFNELKGSHNALVAKFNTFLGHTHPYFPGPLPQASTAVGVPAPTANPSIANIDTAKNTKIKTNS